MGVGCNGLLGIDEAHLRSAEAGVDADEGADGGEESDARPADGGGGDGQGPDLGPFTCTALGLTPLASPVNPQNGPSLIAFPGAPPRWGVAWKHGSSIEYLLVGDTGGAIAGPKTFLPSSPDYSSHPRLALTGSSVALSYGFFGTGAAVYPGLKMLDINGDAGAGAAGSRSPPHDVGGTVSIGSQVVVASRGSGATSTTTTASLFAGGAFVTARDMTQMTRAVSVGWAPTANRIGVAYVVASTPAFGVLETFNPDLGIPTMGASHAFTLPAASPMVNNPVLHLSVAGVGSRFAIAWLDERDGSAEVYVTVLDAVTGQRPPTAERRVSDQSTRTKRFPNVVYDGRSLAVAWNEEVSTNVYRLLLRRFTPDLLPIDDSKTEPHCMNCSAPGDQGKAIGVAAAAPNVYGFAFTFAGSHHFNKLTCSGPN